jgi:hypothetical protein
MRIHADGQLVTRNYLGMESVWQMLKRGDNQHTTDAWHVLCSAEPETKTASAWR